jgi:hypothetical protein
MEPENVNPKNFIVERIIYNDNNFSIAIGIWQEDETRRFATRWNEGNTFAGYPNYAGNPMWFQYQTTLHE